MQRHRHNVKIFHPSFGALNLGFRAFRGITPFVPHPRILGASPTGGDGVRTSALLKTAVDNRPEIWIFQYSFSLNVYKVAFSNIFKIKWPKSEEKLNFGGSWVWEPMKLNPSPQAKLRGDAVATPTDNAWQWRLPTYLHSAPHRMRLARGNLRTRRRA